jgi:NADH-quinone oxidoreductase subunit M
MSGVLLGAIYTLTLVRKMVFGPKTATVGHLAEKVSWSEWLAVAPLIAAMVYLGMRPQFVFDFSRASVEALLSVAR